MTEIMILPDEGCDRVTPLACIHDVVAGVALTAEARSERQPCPWRAAAEMFFQLKDAIGDEFAAIFREADSIPDLTAAQLR
jgi:hypothetical protein